MIGDHIKYNLFTVCLYFLFEEDNTCNYMLRDFAS